ncbi:MAG TPA: hypothetical protein PL195_04925 [bacterium]|nr:hypothetical protein [bacterium]HQJ60596.1 hypothetical protein [bacterium]
MKKAWFMVIAALFVLNAGCEKSSTKAENDADLYQPVDKEAVADDEETADNNGVTDNNVTPDENGTTDNNGQPDDPSVDENGVNDENGIPDEDTSAEKEFVAGYEKATEDVFRSIPVAKINAAKEKLHIAYFHSSHGSRVITGMQGLKNYKDGDDTLYDFTTNGTPVAGKLDIYDEYEGGNDLSVKEVVEGNGYSQWYNETVAFLAEAGNSDINVLMWSWCNPDGHNHQKYIDDMEKLITDYPDITFVFMTGHPNGDGESETANSAYQAHMLIRKHCEENNRFLIDYWDIETHGMEGTYYPNANDNGVSDSTEFYKAWQTSHPGEFFENSCAHTDEDQELTCNRKAYAAWWIWARIAEEK